MTLSAPSKYLVFVQVLSTVDGSYTLYGRFYTHQEALDAALALSDHTTNDIIVTLETGVLKPTGTIIRTGEV